MENNILFGLNFDPNLMIDTSDLYSSEFDSLLENTIKNKNDITGIKELIDVLYVHFSGHTSKEISAAVSLVVREICIKNNIPRALMATLIKDIITS